MISTKNVLARGVSSGARLRSHPVLFDRSNGSTITTVDGETLVDYMLGMGPVLLGHCRPEVMQRVREQLERGELYGTTAEEEILAERLTEFMPWIDHVAFVNSGSEATHLAVRIARAGTGRKIIVKFEGHYHGWIDPLFANTQNNVAAPEGDSVVRSEHSVVGLEPDPELIVLRWNDIESAERLFSERGAQIAGVILEPIPMNFGTMMPAAGYTERLKELTESHGTYLIFDEVLSGFRVAAGGAADLLGVEPHIGVFAKAVANGFPLALVGGTAEAMRPITEGPIVPAGTYSGNPVSVNAGLATLELLEQEGPSLYRKLDELGARLEAGILETAQDFGVPLTLNRVGSVLQLFWGVTGPVTSYAEACVSDRERIAELCEALFWHGALVSPRGLIMLSTEHTEEQIDALVAGLRDVLAEKGN